MIKVCGTPEPDWPQNWSRRQEEQLLASHGASEQPPEKKKGMGSVHAPGREVRDNS
jgi:hypothetical protein